MKKNLPVTNKEIQLEAHDSIISTTDLKGQITYVNKTFLDISGYTENELIGKSHNIVRHPDMPPAAFKDLWKKVKAGQTWRGMVKNRCKNGDHYWVEAFVSPVIVNSELVGFQSVRSRPARDQVKDAEILYASINKTQATELPKTSRFSDFSIMHRIMYALILAGVLPFAGDVLWSINIVSENIMVTLALLSPLIILLTLIFIYQSLFKPLLEISDLLKKVAAGDLMQEIKITENNEMGELYLATKIIQTRLKTVIGQISESSINVSIDAESLSKAGNESFIQMSKQQLETQKVSSAILQISSSIEDVAENTMTVSNETRNAMKEAEENIVIADTLNSTITQLVDEVENSSAVIATLDSKSNDISSIIESINSIAEQTNLLALNAAIEAARAGEQGRGFAVVADEVRTLAIRTQGATSEIKSVIDNLQTEVQNAISVMDKGKKQAVSATEQTTETIKSLNAIRTSIFKINDMSAAIANTTVDQSAASKDINNNMLNISRMSSDTLNSAQITSETSDKLNQNANTLLQQFTMFNIGININQAKAKAVKESQLKNIQKEQDTEVFF